MRRGARSIRGALGTYVWVTVGATAALAFVLWLGPCGGGPTVAVRLDRDAGWSGATVDDGVRLWELHGEQQLELPAGRYRVTLFDDTGQARRETLELTGREVLLGSAPVSAGDADAR